MSLKFCYQPKYDATTNRLKSAEALVRWIREDGDVILPEHFLPLLELSDAITILDWYVVEEVCSFLEQIQADSIKMCPVSVNFSRWHLHEADTAQRLADVMDAHHLAHELLVVEITESAMINEENRMREFVAGLHEKGFESFTRKLQEQYIALLYESQTSMSKREELDDSSKRILRDDL